MLPGVLPVNYMECVNKVEHRLKNWKIFQKSISTELKNSQFFTPVGSMAKVQTKVAHR